MLRQLAMTGSYGDSMLQTVVQFKLCADRLLCRSSVPHGWVNGHFPARIGATVVTRLT